MTTLNTGPNNNQRDTAGRTLPKQAFLKVPCTPQEKHSYIQAAKGRKVALWVVETLNKAVQQ